MPPPLILHLIYRLGRAGLESNLVRMINHMPPDRYRHAIACLRGFTDFRDEIRRSDVPVYDLGQKRGVDWGVYPRLYRLCRELRPAVFHTRNLAAVEGQWVARLAGIPARIHSEEGRDVSDPHGLNRKHNLLRRSIRPIVHSFGAVSQDLCDWLVERIGVPREKVSLLRTGVDTAAFRIRAAGEGPPALGPDGWLREGALVYGWLGRVTSVKDPILYLEAFRRVADQQAASGGRPVRLLLVGDGEERSRCLEWVRQNGLEPLCWIAGKLPDAALAMRLMDVFVLSSIAEGTPNTVLEAMASGLPVVGTRVGGMPNLVSEGVEGLLTPAQDPEALAAAMMRYARDEALRAEHGRQARLRAEREFGIDTMVRDYLSLYDRAAARRTRRP